MLNDHDAFGPNQDQGSNFRAKREKLFSLLVLAREFQIQNILFTKPDNYGWQQLVEIKASRLANLAGLLS